MSSNVSLAQPVVSWNEKTVLENGMQFLGQKKEQLDLYKDLWKATEKTERNSAWYSNKTLQAAKKVRVIAETSKKKLKL